MRRACVVYGGAQERQEILLGGGVSCLFKLKKLNVNLLRLFIDKNLGLELKGF